MAIPVVAATLLAQFDGGRDNLGPGALLVSRPKLEDPNFIHTVVVLVQYSEEKGAFGLIVNRRTAATLSKVLPDLTTGGTHLVYEGGPVQTDLMLALFRTRTKPDDGEHVVADIYETASSDAIGKIAGAATPQRFHTFLGYCGWGVGQLENEVQAGAWSVLPPDPSPLFDDDPDSLWQRLDRKAQMRIAQLLPNELSN